MIYKYEFSGNVPNTNKKITSYVSSPLGLTPDEVFARFYSFARAFDNVKATIN